ncbi:sensor histidine kinase [Primorskyibacter sp. S187A]|uniref:sensor histidine kinase n=1 Tax=Primorskyibacter sp. S187A TaxID=3415130 RepID=UPI003C7BFD7C
MNAVRPFAPLVVPSNRTVRDVHSVLSLMPSDADINQTVLSSAFLASPYASFILDWSGRILVCNRRAERTFLPQDTTLSDHSGELFADLTSHSPDEMSLLLKESAAKGSISVLMSRLQRPVSEVATVFRLALLRSETRGERLYLLTQDQLKATADALTRMNERRKEAYDNLARLERAHLDLRQALLSTEAFSRAASHDLRTPLNTIGGLLELLRTKYGAQLPDGAGEYLDYMGRAVDQMNTLTTELLDHARSNAPAILAEPVDVREIARSAARDAEHMVDEVGGTLTVSGTPTRVMAEPALLQILIANLLANSIKYRSPERALDIEVRCSAPVGGVARLMVRDNGIGFAQSKADEIFRPFVRLGQEKRGMGIGLATCHEVCRRHDWSISAISEPGQGATFTVDFRD